MVLENCIIKLVKQDFSLDANSLSASSVNNSFIIVIALIQLKSTLDAIEINNFRKKCKTHDHKENLETFRTFSIDFVHISSLAR